MTQPPPQQPNQSLNISNSILENVQIGGIAGSDLTVNQTQRIYVTNVYESVQVDQATLSTAKQINQQEYRWRQVLLDKVKQSWIDGVLKKSLHMQVLIELGLEDRNEYIQNPLEKVEEFPSNPGQVFPEGTAAADIFEDIGAGRTLLILGEPGSGKTVTLLKLAESLIARTENDLSQPLPVVVNLSSWAKQRKSIGDWLAQELYEIYQVSKSLGKIWIEEEQLILLLDGLDEVEAKYRNACVQALNQFIQAHGRTEMVVCSRVHDYEALSERLRLRSAIYVQPLIPKQIDQYLDKAGEQLGEHVIH
ncbi:MAG: NACHT domain-containing protein [Cyanobacteria bacterium P01_D01_bin.156]